MNHYANININLKSSYCDFIPTNNIIKAIAILLIMI